MKKLVGLTVAGLMFVGVGCGGSGWNAEDKETLAEGLFAAEALGIFTDAQSDCVSNYLQSHYSSMADVEKAPESDGDKMFDACDIDASDFENWSFGDGDEDIYIDPPTHVTPPVDLPTTTTTSPNLYGSEAADLCYGEAWDGLVELSDSVVRVAELGGTYLTASQMATVNEGLKTMQDTVDACKGIVSADFTSNSQNLVDATKELVRLHTSS